jgi:hypothetical protein
MQKQIHALVAERLQDSQQIRERASESGRSASGWLIDGGTTPQAKGIGVLTKSKRKFTPVVFAGSTKPSSLSGFSGENADNRRLRLSRGVLIDLIKIGVDACAGLALALWLFATPASMWVVGLAACAAMLPDPLQFLHSLSPREPLSTLQRFHSWIHSKRKLSWKLGISSQIAFASAVSALAVAIK